MVIAIIVGLTAVAIAAVATGFAQRYVNNLFDRFRSDPEPVTPPPYIPILDDPIAPQPDESQDPFDGSWLDFDGMEPGEFEVVVYADRYFQVIVLRIAVDTWEELNEVVVAERDAGRSGILFHTARQGSRPTEIVRWGR